MSDQSLRKALIRVAHEHPETRKHLLPLIRQADLGDGILAEGCPDNLDESECDEWEANTEKHKDKFKAAGALNGYIAFYKGKQIEVQADTSYHAQQIAAKKFNARKESEVQVALAEKDGKQVTHKPLF